MEGATPVEYVILGSFWGCIGIMEKKMEATILYTGLYWGYIGIMDREDNFFAV